MNKCKKHPDSKRYKSGVCAKCALAAAKRWSDRNKDKVKLSNRKWRTKNLELHKIMVRKGHYETAGIDPVIAEATRAAHKGHCGCCGGTNPGRNQGGWCIDHEHSTGRIRGVLCHSCNLAIGQLGDTLEGVLRAVR